MEINISEDYKDTNQQSRTARNQTALLTEMQRTACPEAGDSRADSGLHKHHGEGEGAS